VIEWATIAELGTAAGTLVLGVATFAAVRSANRAGRIAERSLRIGLRPILVPSRLEDPPQQLMFVDHHWVTLLGGQAVVELADGVIYLAMMVRNVGNGMAVIQAWHPIPGQLTPDDGWGTIDQYRLQTRDLWVPPADVAFWQGALRDDSEDIFRSMCGAILDGALTVDLSYLDHEGGQRTVSRFTLLRREDGVDGWWVTLSRHHNVGEN
jgi:hypothetical protein